MVARLRDAVGEEDEQVALFERRPILLELHEVESADHRAAVREPLDAAVGAHEHGRVVAGVRVAQLARAVVVEREEERGEAVRVGRVAQLLVDVLDHLDDGAVRARDVQAARHLRLLNARGGCRRLAARERRRAAPGEPQPLGDDRDLRAQRGLQVRHHEGRGQPLARHVSERDGDQAVRDLYEVVVVARHPARGAALARQLDGLERGRRAREELRLHLVCDLYLALQPLALDAVGQQRLDVRRHVVEGEREFAQLVARAHAYAVREVAALDEPGRVVELVHRAGDGARHPRGGKEREKFEGEEGDGEVVEAPRPRLAERGVPPELLDARRPRPVHNERDSRRSCARLPVRRRDDDGIREVQGRDIRHRLPELVVPEINEPIPPSVFN